MPPKPSPGLPDAYGKLVVPQLKQLATACGLRVTGTRGDIISRLVEARASWQPKAPRPRLLSIDLGVRNFAMALMTPVDAQSLPGSERFISGGDVQGREPVLADLHAWERIELVPSDADASHFAPDRMATMAWNLLENKMLPLKPTHIVMERQRSRTMSGASVQEWTLRVNSLEAMLHAMLKILGVTGEWKGTLQSIPPTSATQFWLADQKHKALQGWREEHERKDKGRKERMNANKGILPAYAPKPLTKADTKAQRIHVAKHWLQHEFVVAQTDAVREVRAAFLQTTAKLQPGRTRNNETLSAQRESFKKLDDYADCLCQGMAWLAWQRNTAVIAQNDIPPPGMFLVDKPLHESEENIKQKKKGKKKDNQKVQNIEVQPKRREGLEPLAP